MKTNSEIVLGIPDTKKPGKHFSLTLKQRLFNEPCEFDSTSKIFAISDIEGNFTALLQLLIVNKVIDNYLKWTFGEGHLVVVGDCFDRGEQVVECLWLIYSLEEKAKRKGGYVHFILGNHEIMNLNGDWRYVHPKYARSTKVPFTAVYYGNAELWHWLCTKNIIERIGDVLFVHGGISKEILNLSFSISEINNLARTWYVYTDRLFSDQLLNLIFNSEESPFWYRGYYNNLSDQLQVDATLRKFNIGTIVTGHTVVTKVSSFFNDKVINIDTDHAGGISEALLIEKKDFYRIANNGRREKIK